MIRKYSIFIAAIFVLSACFVAYYSYQASVRLRVGRIPPEYVEKLEQLDFIDHQVLALGKVEAKKHNVVFAGITRDNGRDLPVMINNIERIGQYFKDYRVIIFENDSKDQTKPLLQAWQTRNRKVQIISEDFFNKKRPSMKFLAESRNRYLKILLNKKTYKNFDLVIMLDMDMSFGFDDRGILDSLSKIREWDVVCAHGIDDNRSKTHDVFAFRTDEFPMAPHEVKNYWFKESVALRKSYAPGSSLVNVRSCFGGMAIYKTKFLEGCKYDSIQEDCEHVYLHQCMREKNKARIKMNPTQVVRYSHWHKVGI